MQAGLFEIIIFISVFQLALFTTFLFHKVKMNRGNIWLGIFFISQAICMFDSVISISQYNYFSEHFPSIIHMGLAFRYLWAPSYYFYICSLLGLRHTSKNLVFHALPFLFLITFFCLCLLFPNWSYELVVKQNQNILAITIYPQLLLYNFMCLFHIYQKKNKQNRISSDIYRWTQFFVYTYLLGCTINITFGLFQMFGVVSSSKQLFFYIGHFYFFIFFNIVFYYALIKPTLFNRSEIALPKYAHSAHENDELISVHTMLKNYLENEKAYLKSGITLNEMAALLNVKPRLLSQAINSNEQLNYSDYINSWRINYAKSLLQYERLKFPTILEVLYESGFNSKTSFNQAFKKHTGLTPMEYKKQFQ